jgi:hypothetical protein
MVDESKNNFSSVGRFLDYKTRLGLAIHLGVLGWITLFSQLGILAIDPLWHNGLIAFVGGQMIVFAGAILGGLFRTGNPKVRCQSCSAPMNPLTYKCPICNSTFSFGDTGK